MRVTGITTDSICNSSSHSHGIGEKSISDRPITRSKLSFFCANVQSIRNKFDEFQILVEERKPDVVGITESWLNDDISTAEVHIPGYAVYRQDRPDTFRGIGGGVLLYVRSNLNSIEKEDISGRFVNSAWCEIPSNSTGIPNSITVGVVYRSPNSPEGNDSLLFDMLNKVSGRSTIIMGDFNYPNISWSEGRSDRHGSNFFNVTQDCFFSQHVHFPTRKHNILDLVFSSDPDSVDNVESIGKLGASDHDIIAFDVSCSVIIPQSVELVPCFSKADLDGISVFLSNVNWPGLFHGLNAADSWGVFLGKIHEAMKAYIPWKKRRNKNNRKCWMTREVFLAVKKKRNLWRLYRSSGSLSHMNQFKVQQKLVQRLVSSAKLNFEKQIASNIKDNPRAFFSYVRGKQKVKDSIGPLLDSDTGTTISDSQEMSKVLNNYFSSVFTQENLDNFGDLVVGVSPGSIGDMFCTPDLVEMKLHNLKNGKAPGPDAVYPFILKSFADKLSVPLAVIFNKTLEEGVVPVDWRRANVCPIFKKGKRSLPCNYRPVSLTSVVCKVMESIVRDHMVKYFNENNLIRNSQHGFRKNRSCLTNLLEFMEDVTSAVDNGNSVDIIFLDFQKAFDKVPHKRLLFKLERIGVDGNVLKWIRGWLHDREQRVVVNGRSSTWQKVTSGVPQGSVLGPLLFLTYINDLDDSVQSSVKKFADDTKLYREVVSDDDVASVQRDLDTISKWSSDWQMSFNADKCKVMHVGFHNRNAPFNLNGQGIHQVNSEKDLGVYFDSSLKPSKQCAEAARKGNWILGLIRRHFNFLDKDIVVRLFKQLVRPHLEYAVQVWNPYFSKDKQLIENVQRRATRLISCLRDMPYEERLRRLGLTSLELRRIRGDLIQVFKIVNGLDGLSFDYFFDFSNVTTNRGHRLKLRGKRCRLDVRKYFFSQRVINEWNSLPEDVVLAKSVNAFKNGLDLFFENSGRIL